ncbi:MAG: hypothetical protein PHQ96_07480 [Candidatus Omnitrophica bacterium]|nr:hypothetical protein [Candidatus Omnitrophota bacterium]
MAKPIVKQYPMSQEQLLGNFIDKTMTYDEKIQQEAGEEFYNAIAPSLPDNMPPEMKLAFGANYADVMKQRLQQESASNIKQAF